VGHYITPQSPINQVRLRHLLVRGRN